jgi:uncharacterized protein
MNLQEGSTGSSVIKLQTALSERGLYLGTLDGIFGMQTKEAVVRYQQTQGLKTDGIVGEVTAKSIGIRSFRILCCDGGGVRGVLSARILQEVERQIRETKGVALHEYFDLVAGTSTGSIITAAIASQLNAAKIIELYEKSANKIFPYRKPIAPQLQKIISLFSGAKYDNNGLREALYEMLGDKSINEIVKPIILILAYDMRYRNTTFFTNFHPDAGLRWYDNIPLWQICMSSSAAPTLLPPVELQPKDKEQFGSSWSFPHIDGGVSANNPSLAAISLAMRLSQAKNVNLDVKQKYKLDNLKFEDISVLSIGTGRSGEPYEFEQIKKWTPLNWASRIVDVFMEPTSEIDVTICRNMMGGFESTRFLRLEFDLNERFDVAKDETYKDVRMLIPPKDRKNRFTGDPLAEAIDDSQQVQNLMTAAEKFIDEGHTYYTRDDQGPTVKESIQTFINSN